MKKLISIFCFIVSFSLSALATQPVVAIHVSELTQALETMTAVPPTPTGPGTTGLQWWTPWWHYFVMSDSLKEALRSDGTPFVVVTDADIRAGSLLNPDGSPKYPIVISLASEAISDDEVAPLLSYVSSGGFLLVGSSAFTRKPDGTSRGDFALAGAMGLHVTSASLDNWYQNRTFSTTTVHRLVSHIPTGDLRWRMPLASDDIPWGASPTHGMEDQHYLWQVSAAGATVIANADLSPYLAVTPYGRGNFIYDAAMQPLLGLGGLAPSMYSYGIFRNAIQWAFESVNLPIIKLSSWPYPYNAAYMVRHDFENYQDAINSIEASAQTESGVGARGDYYFCTGTLRVEMGNSPATIDSLRRAVSLYGATIGSHNGGLPNPNNPSLTVSDYDYWHWGPDEALDTQPPGYADGREYAYTSIANSFADLDGWLAGLNTTTRTWVGPYFNSTREGSLQLLDQLGVITAGEQKLSPFPHWTISTETPGKSYRFVSLPSSEWYINGEVAQAIEATHNTSTIDALVNYYYGLGALVNLYSHQPSTNPDPSEYVHYAATKPAIWPVNAATLFGWWSERSPVQVTPGYSVVGNRLVATAAIAGASDPETAVELVIPNWAVASGGIQVKLNGTLADTSSYRLYNQGIKVRVGTTVSTVEVSYPLTAGPVAQDDFYSTNAGSTLNTPAPGLLGNDSNSAGGSLVAALITQPSNGTLNLNSDGSFTYAPLNGFTGSDHFTYLATDGVNESRIATVTVVVNPAGTLLSDDFSGSTGLDPLWVTVSGSWNVVDGTMQGSSPEYSYGYAYANGNWTDYSVQAQIQFPAGAYGGGIGGRVNVANGAHYGAWIYPEASPGGPAVLKLVKFHDWTTWSRTPMAVVSLPSVGTAWHALSLIFQGNRIRISYDGTQYVDITDNGFDSLPAYLNGAISLDLWTENSPFAMKVDNVSVQVLDPTAQNDAYSMTQGSSLNVSVPGVLGNDTGSVGSGMTASLISAPANGSVSLQSDGSFTYTPSPGFIGTDSFTYQASSGGLLSNTATVTIVVNPAGILFSDDFSGQPGSDPLWITVLGSWSVVSGTMQGSSPSQSYGFAYANGNWTDYSVQGRVQFPAGAFGGGIGGRVNSATGARYGVWIYPEGSLGASAALRLIKFSNWSAWSGTSMAQVDLPVVGTTWHTLLATYQGNRIQVSWDGVQSVDLTDNNFDSIAAYPSGGISLDMWSNTPYTLSFDNILVQDLTSTPVAQDDAYSIGQGATLSVTAPGVLSNDTGGGSGATAVLVSQPGNGTLTLQSDGGFTYIPVAGFTGADTFTYQASVGGLTSNTATVTITVNPPDVSSVTLNPVSVTGGMPSTGTVTLSGPAPAGGADVTLTSNNPAATVPASVTVAASSTTATFVVTTSVVSVDTAVTISGTYNNTTQNATLMVTPVPVTMSTVTVNPASVVGGSPSTGTVTLNGLAPAGGAVVTLTSNDPAATVPASVTVAATATAATFTVTTSLVAIDTSVTISGTYNSTTQNATLMVTPVPVIMSSVTVNPTSVVGGNPSTGTVTLSGPAPAGGAVVTLTSNNPAATVPASVTVAANATTATFTATTSPVASATSVTISGTYNSAVRTAILTVSPAVLNSVGMSPTLVSGGSSSTGTVTLSGLAPASGAVVALSSSNTSVAPVPVNVTVAANTSTATFTVTTTPVTSNTTVTISAIYASNTRTANLTVIATTLGSVSLNPTSVRGGSPSTGTLTLNGPAPAGGAVVTLSSSNTSAATVPVSVTVAANTSKATFTVTTTPVASNATATITAIYGTTRTVNLTVTAATLSSVSLSPTSVRGGSPSTGTVTLNGPAPASGAVVTLTSNNPAATVPASVTVPANVSATTFTVTTIPVTSNPLVTISATYRTATRRAYLTVQAATLVSVSLSPTSVKSGGSSTGTVTLNGPAPSGGRVVTLRSSNTAVATVPASMTVPANATTATFTVSARSVKTNTSVTISSILSGVTRRATLTVTP